MGGGEGNNVRRETTPPQNNMRSEAHAPHHGRCDAGKTTKMKPWECPMWNAAATHANPVQRQHWQKK